MTPAFARVTSNQMTRLTEREVWRLHRQAAKDGNHGAQNTLEFLMDSLMWIALPGVFFCAMFPSPVVALSGVQAAKSKGQAL